VHHRGALRRKLGGRPGWHPEGTRPAACLRYQPGAAHAGRGSFSLATGGLLRTLASPTNTEPATNIGSVSSIRWLTEHVAGFARHLCGKHGLVGLPQQSFEQ